MPRATRRGPHAAGPARSPPAEEEAAALARGLTVAGRPLPPPRFHPTAWREGQTFSAQDDPDRTAERWTPPSFVRRDPREQAALTTVEELDVGGQGHARGRRGPCGGYRGGSFARVVRNVLSPADCAELLDAVNRKGYTPALLNIGGGMQKLSRGARDGHRVIVDSPELSAWLMEVLRPHLPAEAGGRQLAELNERLRFLCYTPGQEFPAHCDGCYMRPRGHPRQGDESVVTVQVYLHDVPPEHGGATTFLGGWARGQGGEPLRCQPQRGSALLFTQDLPHEGSLVRKGLKYTVRTEAMYGPRGRAPPASRWRPAGDGGAAAGAAAGDAADAAGTAAGAGSTPGTPGEDGADDLAALQ